MMMFQTLNPEILKSISLFLVNSPFIRDFFIEFLIVVNKEEEDASDFLNEPLQTQLSEIGEGVLTVM